MPPPFHSTMSGAIRFCPKSEYWKMKAFGYERREALRETPLELREVTVQASPDDLESLIAFLVSVRDEMVNSPRPKDTAAAAHWHLRDQDPRWSPGDADLIVVAL
jgi:hypothetical protein